MGRKAHTLAAALSLALVSVPASAVVVFQDSFENPSNTQQWQVYQTFGVWQNIYGQGIEIQTSGTVSGISAYDGRQYVELDSDTERGGVTGVNGSTGSNTAMRTTLSLGAGDATISFFYRPRTTGTNDNGIAVFLVPTGTWSTGSLADYSINLSRTQLNAWAEQSFTLSLASAGSYDLVFRAFGSANELGGFIDLVTVEQLPEPGTLALLGLGMLGLGLARRGGRRTA